MFLAGTVSFLIACGAELTPPPPPPPPPRVTLSLDPTSYTVGLGQSVTVVAQMTGTPKPVAWSLDCDSGQASIVPSGNSATLTGLAGGTGFLMATEGRLEVLAIVSIPPLAPGDPCADDSQCSEAAPKCRSTPRCGQTCTGACDTDDDCPVSQAFGKASCNGHLCILIRDADWTCP